ncbi:MAG TPA: hypothetical protein DCS42_05880 [Nitrospiraceae bacterium]|nr:hypothetical protein [Nitrospiraceae bacterium]
MRRFAAKVFVLIGAGATLGAILLIGCRQETTSNTVSTAPEKKVAEGRVLSVIPDDTQNLFQIDFSAQGEGVAFVQESAGKVRVVLNGKTGNFYQSIGTMIISPDGRRVAYNAFDGDKWRIVIDEKEYPAEGEIGSPVFSPDSRHVAYESRVDNSWRIIIDEDKYLQGQPDYFYHDKFFSSDSKNIITVESTEHNGNIYRVAVSSLTLKQLSVINVQGKNLGFNKEKTMMAFIEEKKGKQRLAICDVGRLDDVKYSSLYDHIIRYVFIEASDAIVYIAERAKKRYLVMHGTEVEIPNADMIEHLTARPDKDAAVLIMNSHDGSYLYQSERNKSTKGKVYEEITHLIYSKDASSHVCVAKKRNKVFIVVNGKEGPALDMVVSPIFSPDEKFLVYRARKDGKRFVVVADTRGKTITQQPSYEQVFQPVFTADGKSVAYGVKDGNKLIWKVEKL